MDVTLRHDTMFYTNNLFKNLFDTALSSSPKDGRYQALVGGCEPLQSYLHKRLAENLNSEAALCTVNDVAQCVQWLRSTFLFVRAARDPKRYLGLPQTAAPHLISKKIEELCVKAMNGLASSGLITMDEASCIESTEAGRLMSIYYLDLETMKHIMKIKGDETLEQLLWIVCESHELSDMYLRVDERRCLNALNRNNSAATIRFPMKGKITTRQMKLNCIIQAVLGCLPILEPSLNQEALKIMRIADRICKCIVSYVTRPNQIVGSPRNYRAVLNSIMLAKCIESHLWENSVFVSKQLKGIGPTFSTLLATAGKSNFMLLEESHPRDLERIMNKGPPAGNVLRKQIGLLPKYQLTVAPEDETSLSLQLTLLNQTYLAENMEQLTAGVNHKCYIIIGDTENCLLSLTSFKDKDLIGLYDGQITVKVTRKHNFEHKVTAHCISSNFVGIDVHCEYQFVDLNGTCKKDTNASPPNEKKAKGRNVKQAAITDTFKVRKRKNHGADEISDEKKKRECFVMEKVDPAKICNDNNIILNFNRKQQKEIELISQEELKIDSKENYQDIKNFEIKHNDESDKENNKDDKQIDYILKEIEQEIYDQNTLSDNSRSEKIKPYNMKHSKIINTYNKFSDKQRKIEKSNFNFIDHMDKQFDVNDREDVIDSNKNTFVDSVKGYIDMFLEKAKNSVNVAENSLANLVEIKNCEEGVCVNDKIDDNSEKKSELTEVNKNDVASKVIEEYNNAPNISASNPRQYQALDFEIPQKDDNFRNDVKVVSELFDAMDARNDNTALNTCDINNVRITHDIGKPNSQYNANLTTVVKENIDDIIRHQGVNHCSSVIQEFDENKISSENESKMSLKSNAEQFISNYPKVTFNSDCNLVKNANSTNLSDRIKCNIDKITCTMELPLLKTVFEHKPLVQSFTSAINNSNIAQSTYNDLEKTAKAAQCRLKSNSNIKFTECYDPIHPNVCNDLNNTISQETSCIKKISFTKTQVYAKDTSVQKYCVMSQLKFDIDITETKTAVKGENALVEHKQNDHLNEINYNFDSIKSLDCSGNSLIPLQFSAVDNESNNTRISVNQEVKDPEPHKTSAIVENMSGKDSIEQKHRTINDIIEKYKNIMSSKSNVNKQTEYRMEGTIASNAESRLCEKTKRPFKITDLPSLHETNRELENTQLSAQKPMYFTSEVRKNVKEDDTAVVMDRDKHDEETLNLEMFNRPDIEQTELSNDETDMSESMFNPKAVLECLKQDIIPPPVQFRDDYISTDRNNIFHNAPTSSNHRFETQSNELKNICTWQSLDNKVFRENEESEQKSSKDVEIWSLSNDDPCQLFKIMSNCSKNFRPQLNVRKARLNEFQFTRKNVFKHRK